MLTVTAIWVTRILTCCAEFDSSQVFQSDSLLILFLILIGISLNAVAVYLPGIDLLKFR